MLSDRQQIILKAVIEDYIKSAKPVSSLDLFEKFDLRVSPATIRNEFAQLEDSGYLSQPHTSAGRLPTEKAYQFYVKKLIEERDSVSDRDYASDGTKLKSELLSSTREDRRNDPIKSRTILKNAAKTLAKHSRSLAFSGLLDSEEVYQSGLTQLLSEPEFLNFDLIFETTEILEELSDHLDRLFEYLDEEEAEVFIGHKNPFGLEECSFIGKRCNLTGQEGFLAVVGPKRMDYRKNIFLIEQMSDYLDNL